MPMKLFHPLPKLDHQRIVAAIAAAERLTSGEIRVALSRRNVKDPLPAAQKQFERLGMTRTRHRNGVLIFVAPRRRQFVVLGDVGIHARAGEAAWATITAAMGAEIRRGDLTAGLERGIAEVGERLAQYFPPDSSRDANELSNELVVEGGGPIR